MHDDLWHADNLARWMIGRGDDICLTMLLDFAMNESLGNGGPHLSIHSQPSRNVGRVNLFCNRDCFSKYHPALFKLYY